MSEVLVGSAFATMELRYQQFSEGVSIVEQQIQRLRQLTKTPIVAQAQLAGAGAGSGGLSAPVSRAPSIDADAAAYTRLQRAQAALEAQQARLARIQGDTARAAQLEAQAEQRLTSELQAQNGITTQSIAIERQLASVQQQAARASQQAAQQQQIAPQATGGGFGAEFTQGIRSGLLGIVGPAAVATAALAGVKKAIDFTEESFKLKAALDTTNLSIHLQLQNFRDVNQTLQEGRAFADRYRITQEENAEAIQASIPLLRQSKASLTDVEGVLSRLAVLKPEQGIQGAAFALAELEGGQSKSLATRFNVPIAQANELKKAIQGGGDAIQVMDAYLNKVGLDMSTLDTRTKGATGKMNELKVETEKLQLALGGAAGGPGLAILETRIRATSGATRILSGDLAGLKEGGQASLQGFIQSLEQANPVARALGQAIDTLTGSSAGLAAQQLRTAEANAFAALGAVRSADADDRAAAAALEAADAATIESLEQERLTRRFGDATAATLAYIGTLRESAQASIEDTAQKNAQSAATALLDEKSRLATDTFLQLHPAISASAAAAAAAEAGYNPQIQRLIVLAATAANAKSELDALTGKASVPEGRSERDRPGDLAAAAAAGAAAARARATALELARQNQTLQTGTALQKVAIEQQRYNEAVRQFGKNSKEAVDAQTNLIQAQQSAAKEGGRGRVSAAQSTALQLNQVEENSGLQLLKTQRENLERLRDQAEDFEVRRSRAQEDFAEKRRKLLEGGQRKQAELASQEFEKQQRREQEDFDRQRRRTLRNNAEGTGDIGARADLRQQQITDRASLRGVRAASGVDLGQAPPSLTGAAELRAQRNVIILRTEIKPTSVQIDGHQIVEITWPETEQRMDDSLAASIAAQNAPGSTQTAIAGGG